MTEKLLFLLKYLHTVPKRVDPQSLNHSITLGVRISAIGIWRDLPTIALNKQ
jgi:hypothetical protein